MLARVAVERPAFVLPPLHRAPLRAGNVVEITGPSASAKSQVLLQAVIHCVLPKEWNGVHFGGLGRPVMYMDLDCRFNVLRLAQCLKRQLIQQQYQGNCHGSNALLKYGSALAKSLLFYEELFQNCMRRFLYIRCYDSYEFLASLKTMHYQFEKEKEVHGVGVHLLMIDSIGDFYWSDRHREPVPSRGINRKSASFQNIMDAASCEVHKLLQMHPMLVLATKSTITGVETSGSRGRRPSTVGSSNDTTMLNNSKWDAQKYSCREYMPSTWQRSITHRIFLSVSDEIFDGTDKDKHPINYTSEWILPPLHFSDRFNVGEVVEAVEEFFSVLHSSPFMHMQQNVPKADVHSLTESAVDKAPFVSVTEDGMLETVVDDVVDMGNPETLCISEEIDTQRSGSAAVETGNLQNKHQENDENADEKDPASLGLREPSKSIIATADKMIVSLKKYVNDLRRQKLISVWLIAYVAIVTTWPLVGGALSIVFRRKKNAQLTALLRKRSVSS